ncbi:hypothetical protein L3Q67_38545 [Saccharothrix sp. AJ9571]|nr:hypothetical protein L3Q67_38545 [Saccharothrix sp. AJ9571]
MSTRLIAEHGSIEAGVEHPARARVRALDLAGEAHDGACPVSQCHRGQVVRAQPGRHRLQDRFVGVDAAAAGDADQGAGEVDNRLVVFLRGGQHVVKVGRIEAHHDLAALPIVRSWAPAPHPAAH